MDNKFNNGYNNQSVNNGYIPPINQQNNGWVQGVDQNGNQYGYNTNYMNTVPQPSKKKGGCLKWGLIIGGIFCGIGIITLIGFIVIFSIISSFVGNVENKTIEDNKSDISVVERVPSLEKEHDKGIEIEKETTMPSKIENSNIRVSTVEKNMYSEDDYIDAVVEIDGWEIILDRARILDTTNSIFKPNEGNVYICLDMSLYNDKDKVDNVSSLLCFDVKVDGVNAKYAIAGAAIADSEVLDGELDPYDNLQGCLSYEIPKDWKTIEIIPDMNLDNKPDAKIILNNDIV